MTHTVVKMWYSDWLFPLNDWISNEIEVIIGVRTCQEIISFALKWRLIMGECYSEGFSFSTMCRQVHELPPEKLKIRDVVHIDIANDPVSSADYKPSEDPTKFKSEKTGRGPLVGPDWMKKVDPVMTCYKLVTCEFKWFGLQSRIENFIQKSERRLFTTFHRWVLYFEKLIFFFNNFYNFQKFVDWINSCAICISFVSAFVSNKFITSPRNNLL